MNIEENQNDNGVLADIPFGVSPDTIITTDAPIENNSSLADIPFGDKVNKSSADIQLESLDTIYNKKKEQVKSLFDNQDDIDVVNAQMEIQYQKEKDRILAMQQKQLKDTSVLSRVGVGLGEFQGQFRKNVLVPIANFLGMTDTAKELEQKGDIQINASKKIEEEFKKQYGENSWNIAQNLATFTPDIAMSFAAGAKNIPQAIGEGAVTYARTGSAKEAGSAAVISFFGGKLADKLFSLGSKAVKTSFGKEIDNLPLDQKKIITETLDTLESAGIDTIDETTRKKVLENIDLTAPKEEVSKQVKEELKALKTKAWNEYEQAYKKADELGKQTEKISITTSDINKELLDKGVRDSDKVNKAKLKIAKMLSKRPENSNAYELETTLQNLKDLKDNAKSSDRKAYSVAIDYVQKKQDEIGQGIYAEARKKSLEYNTIFKGTIKGEGSDTGRKLESLIRDNTSYDISNKLLTRGANPDLVKNLNNLGLSSSAKTSIAKDFLSKGVDTTNLDTASNVKKVISNFNAADANGMQLLLGKEGYNNLRKKVVSLEHVHNVLNATNIDEAIKKDIAEFISSAMMVKISPVYAAKGVVYKGKDIVKKTLFRRETGKIRDRIKTIKDATTRNKLMKAFNAYMIGYTASELDTMFSD